MPSISPLIALFFIGSVGFQIVAIAVMPLSKGFTVPIPTAIATGCFVLGLTMLARLIHSGANLGILIPLMSSVIPLCMVAIGIVFYGESATFLRVGMLVTACLLVGSATMV